jgi:hypothetical protein
LPSPADGSKAPTDWGFCLKNKVVGRKDPACRSTANGGQSSSRLREMRLAKQNVTGPVGYSE